LVTWGPAAGGAWETPANWSSGSLPGPDDDVVISALSSGNIITHASDNTFIHSLNFNTAGTLNLNGGTLAVAVTSTVDTGTTLNLNGGTLDGTGDWVFNGALNWTAGTMSGAGTTTVNGGLTLGGTSIKTLDRHTLTIPSGAAANWTTGTVAGGLTLTDGATLNNAGTFTLQTDVTIAGTGILSVFNNTGTFRLINTTATTTIGAQFNSSGLTDVQSGTLSLNGGGTGSGNFTVAALATLNFGGGLHQLNASSTISGNGSVGFSAGVVDEVGSYGVNGGTAASGSGAVTFWGTVTSVGSSLSIANSATVDFGRNSITVPAVTMSGGTLLGVGNVDVTGNMSWTGGTMGDLGSTTIDTGAALNMMMGGARTLDGRTLNITNMATANWSTGTIALNDGAVINNQAGASFIVQVDTTLSTGGQLAVFNNAGLFLQQNSTGVTTIATQFNNTGTVDVRTGTLVFSLGGVSGPSAVYTVEAIGGGTPPATLSFAAGTQLIAAGTTVSGAGNVVFTGTVLVEVQGRYNVTGSTTFNGSSSSGPASVIFQGQVSSVGSALTITSTTFGSTIVNFGTNSIMTATCSIDGNSLLQGSGDVAVTGLMTWAGGTMADLGSTTIAPGATLTINGSALKTLDGRTLNVSPTAAANWSEAGNIALNNGALLSNAGTFMALNQSTISGTGTFLNTGAFTKSTNTGTTIIGAGFNNNGAAQVLSGTLNLSGGGSSSGSFTVMGTPSTPSTLTFGGGTHSLSSSSSITGTGTNNVVFTGTGIVQIAGTYGVSGSSTFNASTFPGSLTVIFLGSITNVGSTLTITSTPPFGFTVVNFGANSITTDTCSIDGNSLLQGSGDVSVTGSMTWAGGTMAGRGSTTIAPSATLTITGSAAKTLDGRALNISPMATANWLQTGNIALNNGAVLNNAGTFNDETQQAISTAGVLGVINNSGLFRQVSNTGTTTLGTRFNNTGTVDVQTGTLVLSLGGVSGNGSILTVEAPATLMFGGGLYDVGVGATLGGAGRVVFSGGKTRIDGTYNITGSTAFSGSAVALFFGSVTAVGSSVTLANNSVANFGVNNITTPTATISGGFLEGVGDFNVTGSLTWSGGILYGHGSVTVGTGTMPATLTMTGSLNMDGRTLNLTNMATATWTGTSGNLAFSDVAVMNILSGATFNAENNQSTFSGSGVVNNAGTFRKTTSTGPTTINLPFNNSGQVQVSTGSMIFAGGGTSTGTFNVSGTPTAPPTLTFGGGIHQLLAGSSITGSGASNTVTFTGGEVDIFGTVSVTGPVNVSGASTVVYFLHDAFTGTFTISTGTVAIEPGNTLTVTGVYTQSGGTTDLNAATLTATNVNITAGTLFASGTITAGTVTNGGTLSFGGPVTPGVLTINGNYTQTGTGTLNIRIGGQGSNQFDQLNVNGDLTLMNGSRLNVSLIDGFLPPSGSTYQVLTWSGSRAGTFTNLSIDSHFMSPPTYDPMDMTIVAH
jgi:hypothetical protein